MLVALPFGLLGQFEPLARQFFILAFGLRIANAVREFPAFCRVSTELLGSRLHAAPYGDLTWNGAWATIALRRIYVTDVGGDAM